MPQTCSLLPHPGFRPGILFCADMENRSQHLTASFISMFLPVWQLAAPATSSKWNSPCPNYFPCILCNNKEGTLKSKFYKSCTDSFISPEASISPELFLYSFLPCPKTPSLEELSNLTFGIVLIKEY
jgi:hypothetical protein